MSINEYYVLVVLLIKYRANEFVSHRKRDLIDEIVLDCLKRLSSYALPETPSVDDISF